MNKGMLEYDITKNKRDQEDCSCLGKTDLEKSPILFFKTEKVIFFYGKNELIFEEIKDKIG